MPIYRMTVCLEMTDDVEADTPEKAVVYDYLCDVLEDNEKDGVNDDKLS